MKTTFFSTIYYWLSNFCMLAIVSSQLQCQIKTIYKGGDLDGTSILLFPPNIFANTRDKAEIKIVVRTSQGTPAADLSVQVNAGSCQVEGSPGISGPDGSVRVYVRCQVAGTYPITLAGGQERFSIPIAATTTLTAYDDTYAGSLTIRAGQPLSAQVIVWDKEQNPDLAYRGTVGFRSSDQMAILPANYTFQQTDRGVKIWVHGVIFNTVGEQVLTMYDIASGRILEELRYQVLPGSLGQFVLKNCARQIKAGQSFACPIEVQDKSGNSAPNYLGRLSITSNDSIATLPDPYIFTADDNGTALFEPWIFRTAGEPEVTLFDGAIRTTVKPFAVEPLEPASLRLNPDALVVVGQAQYIISSAHDIYGNLTLGKASYTLETSDTTAQLSDQTVDLSATGRATTQVIWKKSGWQTLTIKDPTDSLPPTQVAIWIEPGTPVQLRASFPQSPLSYQIPAQLNVQILDVYGNVTRANGQIVTLTVSDANAQFQPTILFPQTDWANSTVPIAFQGLGSQSIAIFDTSTALLPAEASIAIDPGPATTCQWFVSRDTIIAGDAIQASFSMQDIRGDTDYNYVSSVSITRTEEDPNMPNSTVKTFSLADRGIYNLPPVYFTRSGLQKLQAIDILYPSKRCEKVITVEDAGAIKLQLISPSTIRADNLFSLTVAALDTYNNVDPNYIGDITLQVTYTGDLTNIPSFISITSQNSGIVEIESLFLRKTGTYTISAESMQEGWRTNATMTVLPTGIGRIALTVDNLPVTNQGIAGEPLTPTIKIFDTFDNLLTNYTGTIYFTSNYLPGNRIDWSDPNTLPSSFDPNQYTEDVRDLITYGGTQDSNIAYTIASYTFRSSDAGVKSLPNAWIPYRSGIYSLQASNGSIAAETDSIAIQASDPNRMQVLFNGTRIVYPRFYGSLSEIIAAASDDPNAILLIEHTAVRTIEEQLLVLIYDQYNNLVDWYQDTIELIPSDASVAVISPLQFTPSMKGVGVFPSAIRFNNNGVFSVEATAPGHQISTTIADIRVDKIQFISAGSANTLALMEQKGTVGWGRNPDNRGPFGWDGVQGANPSVRGWFYSSFGTQTTTINNWLDGFVPIALSQGLSDSWCGQSNTGMLKCFGRNVYGQLGYENINPLNPNPTAWATVNLGTQGAVSSIVTGFEQACAILQTGALKCWGLNSTGNLGYGDTFPRGLSVFTMGDFLPSVDLGTNRTALAVQVGQFHTCAVLDNQHVKCWGYNATGQLGLGDTINRGALAFQMGDNLPSVSLHDTAQVSSIAAGVSHTCVLLTNQELKCWGDNRPNISSTYFGGILGLGDEQHRGDDSNEMGMQLSPVDLGAMLPVQVVAGAYHTCARTADGKLKCWGFNQSKQLGLDDRWTRGDDLDDMGDNLPFLEFTRNLRATDMISLGENHSCVVLQDGRMYCFGSNDSGEIGIGKNIIFSLPKPASLNFIRLW